MAGIALNNGTLLPKPVEYFFMPFYTFRHQEFSGSEKLPFNKILYNSFIRLASLSLEGEQFEGPGYQDYNRYRVGLNLYFQSVMQPI